MVKRWSRIPSRGSSQSDDDLAGLFNEVPDRVSDQCETGPASDVAEMGDAEFDGLFRRKLCPQPESTVAENCKEEEDVMEVLERHGRRERGRRRISGSKNP